MPTTTQFHRFFVLTLCSLAILFSCSACGNRSETRSDYQDRSRDKKDWLKVGQGDTLSLSDPMMRNVNAGYRNTYILWQADHNRLAREMKDRNTKGIKIWTNNVLKDLKTMKTVLANEKDQEYMDEVMAEYGAIKSKGIARQDTSLNLHRLDRVRRDFRKRLSPGTVELRQKEIIDEPAPDKNTDDEQEKDGPKKVKPKW